MSDSNQPHISHPLEILPNADGVDFSDGCQESVAHPSPTLSTKSGNDGDEDRTNKFSDVNYLIIRCTRQTVPGNATFNLGALKKLYVMTVSSQASKKEKRIIRVSQSVPFIPHGRPPK